MYTLFSSKLVLFGTFLLMSVVSRKVYRPIVPLCLAQVTAEPITASDAALHGFVQSGRH